MELPVPVAVEDGVKLVDDTVVVCEDDGLADAVEDAEEVTVAEGLCVAEEDAVIDGDVDCDAVADDDAVVDTDAEAVVDTVLERDDDWLSVALEVAVCVTVLLSDAVMVVDAVLSVHPWKLSASLINLAAASLSRFAMVWHPVVTVRWPSSVHATASVVAP